MRFAGRTFRSGRYWAVEVPDLGLHTQGTSRANAHTMAAEALEIIVDRAGFKATVYPGTRGYFEITGNDQAALIALFLGEQRRARGLSLAQVSGRLGLKSRNAYARYEQGRSVPTVDKLAKLLAALDPGRDFVLMPSQV